MKKRTWLCIYRPGKKRGLNRRVAPRRPSQILARARCKKVSKKPRLHAINEGFYPCHASCNSCCAGWLDNLMTIAEILCWITRPRGSPLDMPWLFATISETWQAVWILIFAGKPYQGVCTFVRASPLSNGKWSPNSQNQYTRGFPWLRPWQISQGFKTPVKIPGNMSYFL